MTATNSFNEIGYVFRCTNATQEECFQRMLFGETENAIHQQMVENIRAGNFLFLHNNNTGTLFGVFRAVSNGQRDIVKNAWGGKFPWQVRAEWNPRFPNPLPRQLSQKIMHFWGKTKRHPSEYLSSHQVGALIELYKSHESLPPHEEGFRNKFPAHFRATDGHWVRSFAEVIIDNWLFHQEIPHGYERKLPIAEQRYCDFFIPIKYDKGFVYIEYWGMDDEEYEKRRVEKTTLYKANHLPLIELTPADIDHLDDVMPMKLRQYLPDKKYL